MTIERLEISPDIWLNYVQTDRFKTGCFSINLVCPLDYHTAAANALIPSILLRGCRTSPTMQDISQRLDMLFGGSIGTLIRKKGEYQTVGFYADFLEDRYAGTEPVFQEMMQFLKELIFEPCLEKGGFIPEYFEGEKCNLVNTLDARINDKRSYAISRLLKHMCKGETYAVPRLGEKETLAHTTPVGLYKQWQQMLASCPMDLFYLGQQSKTSVVETMNSLLSPLPERHVHPAALMGVPHPVREPQLVEEALDVTQGKLAMGLRTPITARDPRYPALMLLNAIYGSGMTSKLFLKIREEQSLCYYANSSLDRLKGLMIIGSGIEFQNFEVARDGILHQLDLCKQGDITDDEMDAAKSYLISALQTGQDSPGRLDDYAIAQSIAGLTGTMEELAQQLQGVTREQVIEAANTLTLDTVYFLKGVGV